MNIEILICIKIVLDIWFCFVDIKMQRKTLSFRTGTTFSREYYNLENIAVNLRHMLLFWIRMQIFENIHENRDFEILSPAKFPDDVD